MVLEEGAEGFRIDFTVRKVRCAEGDGTTTSKWILGTAVRRYNTECIMEHISFNHVYIYSHACNLLIYIYNQTYNIGNHSIIIIAI